MGWAAFGAGAMGYLGNRMEQDRQLQLKDKLETARQKREEFLLQYKSQLDTQERLASEKQKDEEKTKDETENYNRGIKATRGGVFGYNARGDVKKLRDLTDEEKANLDQEDEQKKLEIEAKRAGIANAASGAAMNNAYKTAAIEEMKSKQEARDANKRLSPQEREQQKFQEEVVKLASNKDFAAQAMANAPDGVDPDLFVAQAAAKRLQAVKGALGGAQPPAQSAKPSPDEIIAKANEAVKNGADPKAVEARTKELFMKYGYQPQ